MQLARDRRSLYLTAFLRALATGMMGVMLGIYLAKINLAATEIGLVVSVGLAGAALSALIASLWGDRWGRRRLLFWIAICSALAGAAAGWASSLVTISVAAFFGMINGMGRDRGAALILEQAILPSTTSEQKRTRVFAWYNLVQDVGHALGGLLAAIPELLVSNVEWQPLSAYRVVFILYASMFFIAAILYLRISRNVEPEISASSTKISPASRSIVFKISALFAVDSIGGGFLGTALLAFFFLKQFGTSETLIAVLFMIARVMNALSHLGAAWLAKRIGLVNTMVFTHIPSSLLLITVAFAPNFLIAAVLFVLRESLVEMDVPTRQSYVMAVVKPEERTFASGITQLTRMAGWAVAPSIAGVAMQFLALSTPLIIGAGLKITYDVLLYRAFRHIHPPEETGS